VGDKRMKEYLRVLNEVLEKGDLRPNRTGTDTYSKFNVNAEYDISNYRLPLLTTKRVYYPAIIHELIWMLSGSDNIKYLQDNNVRIWNEWADEDGNLNKVYGKQWRYWNDTRVAVKDSKEYNYCIEQKFSKFTLSDPYVIFTRYIDQIKQIEDTLQNDPYSRRIILTAWNVANIDEMALPPCHTLSQFYVRNVNGKQYLDCTLYQRSGDIFLGVPFNIVFYSLFVHMLCHVHGFLPGKLYHTIGDAHIYVNHMDQVKEQLSRSVIDCSPTVSFNADPPTILDFQFDDISISGYESHKTIKADVAV
jgi:thymidylate synthase